MNVELAANSSRSFKHASKRCEEHRPLKDGNLELLAVPAIVCEAFSVELGLKALIMRKSSPAKIKGHNLADLFGKLFTSEQMALIEAVACPEAEFRNKLASVSTSFEDWRYIYESSVQKSLDLRFLHALSAAVQARL